ncbi:MAG: HAD family hydrolase [Bacteroidales bacterium]|jgi:histidinol-phosphate phosphatase family protein|nr:HAD family hydrolase [Bacteroidales bacterium]MDI9574833.1 HAD family hydrolase [Bacteroidota bacterium]MDD3755462.1 HAD family hydrolase [Bacteroidales bacterium]MDY0400791.1 HAD family hydrolase [Bacteroidales bacterium]HHW59161.1 HAD family hydrolase [Bacteroidales bacterium]
MSAYNQKVLSEWNIHKNWTLFLDRDGVINKRKIGDYIKIIDEFEFIPNTKEALAILDKYFNKIIIVTNQQGIGKGLMSEKDLQEVHNYMHEEILRAGGRIDAIYFCPDLASSNSQYRKPNPGMALKAKEDFPVIDFSHSMMVGDTKIDMEFAQNLGAKKIFIGDLEEDQLTIMDIDLVFNSLYDFALEIHKYYQNL